MGKIDCSDRTAFRVRRSEGDLLELREQRIRNEAEVHCEEDTADELCELEASHGSDAVDANKRAEENDREGHQVGGINLGRGGWWGGGEGEAQV